jgi:hypothetical protein
VRGFPDAACSAAISCTRSPIGTHLTIKPLHLFFPLLISALFSGKAAQAIAGQAREAAK